MRPPSHLGATLAVIALVIGVSAVTGTAFAQSAADLDARAERARERARELEGEVEAQGQQLAQGQAEASTAAERAAQLADRLSTGRERLAELNSELERARSELRRARSSLRRSQRALADRLVAIYKDGRPDEIALLLGAVDFDEFANRAEYLQRIQQSDDALIARARERRAAVDKQVEASAGARDEQRVVTAELEDAAAEAAAERAAAEQRAAAIAAARSAGRARLGELRERADRLDRRASRASSTTQGYGAPSGGWAIPEAIVMCESGGNWSALNPISGAGGAYQILPSTWKLYGGKGLPHEAPPAEQNRIAAMIWADSGPSAWECAG